MKFNKQPLTYQDQIELWESRGLVVDDHHDAEPYLHHISYYRLSAYALSFQSQKDIFIPGTTFQQVLDLYVFDRELRLLVMDAIERLEVAFRTQFIYQLAHKYGSHFHLQPALYVPDWTDRNGRLMTPFADFEKIFMAQTTGRNREVFVDHYMSKYTHPPLPPSWMALELLTIGELSRLYTNLRQNSDKAMLAQYFGLHHTVFKSWLHALTYCRNLCAHHSRFWNRDLQIQPDLLQKPVRAWIDPTFNNNRRSYYLLCCIQYLLAVVNPTGHFVQKLKALIEKHPDVPIQYMGFTQNWKNEPLWT